MFVTIWCPCENMPGEGKRELSLKLSMKLGACRLQKGNHADGRLSLERKGERNHGGRRRPWGNSDDEVESGV